MKVLTEEVSFGWLQHRISTTDSTVRTTYYINTVVSYESTAEEVSFE